ncbi:hypothetical protein [Aureliella helgolandensis]|uniref:Uncharacterized protein n=1 Tax=Aureliella helgolandensis TaxID=2527968 RepID=A0A518GC03_9BACT|nr:hypothetical protein [Aureliella helgolandensis]QDV26103.1 hypothetical protein Q31a_44750 [Aureliella helgolandensis]
MTSELETTLNTASPWSHTQAKMVAATTLLLRDADGQILEQWAIQENKSTFGSHESCGLRCTAAGIAPYHALIVVGARQTFIRALASKISRDNVPITEILLTGESEQFEIAGHCFELTRKPVSPLRPSQTRSTRGTAKPPAAGLKFTLARPFQLSQAASRAALHATTREAEKNVENLSQLVHQSIQADRESGKQPQDSAAPQADTRSSFDSAWIKELVKTAVEPLETQLQELLAPIAKLQEEARQRSEEAARQQEELPADGASQASCQPEPAPSQTSLDVQQLEQVVVRQAAEMEVLGERLSDVNQQLGSIERLITEESTRNREASPSTEESPQANMQQMAIEQLQHGIVAVTSALTELQSKQEATQQRDNEWKSQIQTKLETLQDAITNLGQKTAAIGQESVLSAAELEAYSAQLLAAHTIEEVSSQSNWSPEAASQELVVAENWSLDALERIDTAVEPTVEESSAAAESSEALAAENALPAPDTEAIDSVEEVTDESWLAPTVDDASQPEATNPIEGGWNLLQPVQDSPSLQGESSDDSNASDSAPSDWSTFPTIESNDEPSWSLEAVGSETPDPEPQTDTSLEKSGIASLDVEDFQTNPIPLSELTTDDESWGALGALPPLGENVYDIDEQVESAESTDVGFQASEAGSASEDRNAETTSEMCETQETIANLGLGEEEFPTLDPILLSPETNSALPSVERADSKAENAATRGSAEAVESEFETLSTLLDDWNETASPATPSQLPPSQSKTQGSVESEEVIAEDCASELPSWWVEQSAANDSNETPPHDSQVEIFPQDELLGIPDEVAAPNLPEVSNELELQRDDMEALESVSEHDAAGSTDEEPEFFGLGLDAELASPISEMSAATSPAIEELPAKEEPEFNLEEAEQPNALAVPEQEVNLELAAPEVGASIADDISSADPDDDVEEYMRRLLARMRGVPEDEVAPPKPTAAVSQAVPEPIAGGADTKLPPSGELSQSELRQSLRAEHLQKQVQEPAGEDGSASQESPQVWDGHVNRSFDEPLPFDPTKYAPRTSAPDRTQDFSAMRELANSSARSAITKSSRQRAVTSVVLKTVIALIGFAVATVLIAINGFNINIGLIATFASLVVGAIWGYDAVSSMKPLLQASFVLNPPAGQVVEEDLAKEQE